MEGGEKKKGKKRKECILSFFEFNFWWDVSFARVAYFLGVIGCYSSTLWSSATLL